MHILETRNLCYSYAGGIDALKNVNFIAPRATGIAVLGANGAGKSTLFRHFNGILSPTSGEVLIHGEVITKKNVKEVRKTVGLVFQNPDDQIFSPTVEQDVAFGPVNLGLDEETVAHRVESTLSLLGIEDLAERAPHRLSGGEKKKVAIAGILAMEPQVLVLDEPTSGLDPQGVIELVSFLKLLPVKYGMTVITATHQLDQVPEIADYAYVMNGGQIAGQGTPDEIFIMDDLLKDSRLDVPLLRKLVCSLQENGVEISTGYSFTEVEETIRELITGKV